MATCGFLLFSASDCEHTCDENERCKLVPDGGSCKALFIKYYYDQEERKCKEFTWGGCDGVVPFQTLEECQQNCQCGN